MNKSTILIVEDEAIVAADLESKLMRSGYEVVGTASSGEEAIKIVQTQTPHLILMDIELEGRLDGIETARTIQAQYDVPVVYLTANADQSKLSLAKHTDAFGYIIKPFDERDLATQIELALHRHLNEERLRRSEAFVKNVLNAALNGIYVYDLESGRNTFINPEYSRLTGYTLDAIKNMSADEFFALFHPEDQPAITAHMEELSHAVNGDVLEIEYRFRHAAGHWIWCFSRDSVFDRDPDGAVSRFIGCFLDITQRKQSEEALRITQFSFDRAAIGIYRISSDAKILEVNEKAAQMLGYTKDELTGMTVFDIDPATSKMDWVEIWQYLLDHGSDTFERVHRAKDGRNIPVEINSQLLEYGGQPYSIAFAQDITERKRAEARARREHRETLFANRVLRAFAECEGDELFDQALAVVQEEMASMHGVFGYIAEPGHLHCPSLSKTLDACEVEGKCIHYPPNKWKGLWARALKEKRSLYINEAPHVPPGHSIIHNNLAAPILFQGDVIGLLNIANKDGGYTDSDRDTLDRIADRIAPVLYAWIQRKLREDDRKAARAELEQLAQQRQLALDAAKLGWWQFDPNTREIQLDDNCRAIFGLSDNTRHTGNPLQNIIHPEDLPALMTQFETGLDPTVPQRSERKIRINLPGGHMIWVQTHGIATFDGNDIDRRVVKFVGTVQDITDRKLAERSLLESEQRLRSIMKAAPYGAHIYELDADDQLVFSGFNEAAERILGTDHRPFVGKTITEAFPLLADTDIPKRYAQVAENGKPFDAEQVNYDQGAIQGVFEVHAVQTEPRQMVAFFRDITGQKKAEEALEESERRFRSIANGLPLIVWVHDAKGRPQFVNQTFREFFGLSVKDLEDDRWRMLLYPDDGGAFMEALKACVRDQRPLNKEVRVKRADGQWRWIESWAKPRFSSSGKFIGFVGTGADITEKKEAEASLQRLNQTLEQQVAERTVELESRTKKLQSLAIQLSEAEELERQRIAQLLHDDLQQQLVTVKMKLYAFEPSFTDRCESDEVIGKCIDLLGDAVEKTRKLSRDLSPGALCPRGLLDGIDMIADQFKEDYGLEANVSRSGDPEPESLAITAFLFQAVKELLFNVVKHSGATTANIHVVEKQDHIEIRVADDGKGDDPEQVYARRGVEPGFGLFSIEERIHALGGEVTIESVPGDGWITTLTVPKTAVVEPEMPEAARDDDTAAAETSASGEGPSPWASGDGIRILVVDDHEGMREGLASLLSLQEGFQVIGQAGDGQAAVDMAGEHQPDVILMDISLPKLDGVEATKRIIEKAPGIAVIGLSMHSDETTRQKMIAAGAAAFVSKSEAAERIVKTIKQLVPGKESFTPDQQRS